MPQTVIVVGAGGFVGQNLVRHLKGKIGRVLPVGTSGSAVAGIPGLRWDELDSVDLEPDTVLVNLAAFRHDGANFARLQPQILAHNIEIATRIYEFCGRRGIAEVRAASSIAVYPADEASFDDSAPLDLNADPHDGELMYAWSKRIGEVIADLFARKCGINTVTFRLTNPYGPHDGLDEARAHVIPAFVIRALATGGPFAVRGNPEASRDFIYVGDVCEAFARSLTWRGRSGAYNLGSGENVSIGALAHLVLNLTGSERDIVVSGAAVSAVPHRRCRNDRLRADFGFDRFTQLEDGLRSTIEWYRDALARP